MGTLKREPAGDARNSSAQDVLRGGSGIQHVKDVMHVQLEETFLVRFGTIWCDWAGLIWIGQAVVVGGCRRVAVE
ncbi:hypothetical protein AYO49_04235 [Verrucomicrobiaceae bacterium SCGC AG-212-N21]|nr:hypothetical protein AYO49_04235 [Verrucomicrobiaceae bacterium SCGC AG-212-N21]